MSLFFQNWKVCAYNRTIKKKVYTLSETYFYSEIIEFLDLEATKVLNVSVETVRRNFWYHCAWHSDCGERFRNHFTTFFYKRTRCVMLVKQECLLLQSTSFLFNVSMFRVSFSACRCFFFGVASNVWYCGLDWASFRFCSISVKCFACCYALFKNIDRNEYMIWSFILFVCRTKWKEENWDVTSR